MPTPSAATGGDGFELQELLSRMAAWGDRPAVFCRGVETGYRDFLADVDRWSSVLKNRGIGSGSVCGVGGDFSLETCTLFFALMRMSAVIVPFSVGSRAQAEMMILQAGVVWMIEAEATGEVQIRRIEAPDNPVIAAFRAQGRPGLIIFTSGSSGTPKGILHNCDRLLRKFVEPRTARRTLLFLAMDHFGGFNTLLSVFAYGGTAVCVAERRPEPVCSVIEQAKVELLPVTPTFLRLLSLSGTWRRYDLSSVELVTYGAEPMPPATLEDARAIFPSATFKQTYGLSEVGVLNSRSAESGSIWLQIGGEGFETRIVDGVLWIRSASSMVGYLNAPTPFDEEGWMNTGDEVEEQDGFIRFRGRTSDIINVGGEKVFPMEVEEVLLQAPNVADATVVALEHPLLGQVPAAVVRLREAEPEDEMRLRLRRHCLERLAKYKVPMRFTVAEGDPRMTNRLKKARELPDA